MIPKKLLDEINRWINESRYGSIEINFQNGNIVNLNIKQSLRVESLGIYVGTTTVFKNEEVKI